MSRATRARSSATARPNSASEIARESLKIASGIDIYTNDTIAVEEL